MGNDYTQRARIVTERSTLEAEERDVQVIDLRHRTPRITDNTTTRPAAPASFIAVAVRGRRPVSSPARRRWQSRSSDFSARHAFDMTNSGMKIALCKPPDSAGRAA